MLVCFCFVFLILFNACKYFERPLGNQLPKCVEGLPFLNKSHNNNNNSYFTVPSYINRHVHPVAPPLSIKSNQNFQNHPLILPRSWFPVL